MKDLFKRNPKQAVSGDNNETRSPQAAPATPEAVAPGFKKLNPIKGSGHHIPDDLWVKCPKCKELLYSKELNDNKKVCHKCGHHFRLGARERIAILMDEDSFVETDANLISGDPLNFVSSTEPPYILKSQQLREKTNLNEAVITGYATVEELPLALCVADFTFQGGSMGSVFGEKLVRIAESAFQKNLPLLTVSSSGGARMHEGIFSLMQMAKTIGALARLGERRLLHISLLADPVLGGVPASYASVADFILAEPGAFIGFAGPRVIEQTTRQKLPAGFQTAEFQLEHGMIDMVVPRKELRTTIVNLLRLYKPASQPVVASVNDTEALAEVVYA